MGNKSAVIKALKDAMLNGQELYSIPCTVYSVDTTEKTCYCIPLDKRGDLQGVRLMADNTVGFWMIPKVNSIVIVTMINEATGYVAQCSEFDFMYLNGDAYGGLVKVKELTDKINALENLTNNILTALKGTTIPLAPTGTYPFAPLYAAFNLIAPITTKAELENTTVLHGDGS